MNLLMSIIKELVQHLKLSNFFLEIRQYFKMQNKIKKWNNSPIGMSPSAVIFNLVRSLTNDWSPPLGIRTRIIPFFMSKIDSELSSVVPSLALAPSMGNSPVQLLVTHFESSNSFYGQLSSRGTELAIFLANLAEYCNRYRCCWSWTVKFWFIFSSSKLKSNFFCFFCITLAKMVPSLPISTLIFTN